MKRWVRVCWSTFIHSQFGTAGSAFGNCSKPKPDQIFPINSPTFSNFYRLRKYASSAVHLLQSRDGSKHEPVSNWFWHIVVPYIKTNTARGWEVRNRALQLNGTYHYYMHTYNGHWLRATIYGVGRLVKRLLGT